MAMHLWLIEIPSSEVRVSMEKHEYCNQDILQGTACCKAVINSKKFYILT